MDKSEIKQLERIIEVVLRSIPKERQARDVFLHAARESKAEMAKVLFEAIASQEEQHETKLKVALELLKQELDEARGKGVPDIGLDHMEEEDLPKEKKIEDLERVMEVVLRMLPKEHSARELYSNTARQTRRDLTRTLFEWLADQESQHESKLCGILDLLKLEIHELRGRK